MHLFLQFYNKDWFKKNKKEISNLPNISYTLTTLKVKKKTFLFQKAATLTVFYHLNTCLYSLSIILMLDVTYMAGSFAQIKLWNREFDCWKLTAWSSCFIKVTLLLPKGQVSNFHHASANKDKYFQGLKFSWFKKTKQKYPKKPKPHTAKKKAPKPKISQHPTQTNSKITSNLTPN